jgi:hypothetical protein
MRYCSVPPTLRTYPPFLNQIPSATGFRTGWAIHVPFFKMPILFSYFHYARKKYQMFLAGYLCMVLHAQAQDLELGEE